MIKYLIPLLFLATVYSRNLTQHEDCKIRFLSNPVAPTRLKYNVTNLVKDIGSKLLRNTKNMNFSTASRNVLSLQPDISGIALSKIDERILALNINSRLKIFRNQTLETDVFWKAFSSSSDGWGKPFQDCNFFSANWFYVYVYSVKSVRVGVFIALNPDRCDNNIAEIFGGPHKCDTTQMCVSEHDVKRKKREAYRCLCQRGFFYPGANMTWTGISGSDLETGKINSTACYPCPHRCPTMCGPDGICIVQQDAYLKTTILCIQLTIMGITVFLALFVFKQRKTKAIATGCHKNFETIDSAMFA